ncbi:MGH1-like glycoside hydrolase domain-containing protein [Actinomadura alba]|uniref:Mannosylglycerate hydrolase MGH1-like glycoside hydrolase domain-containing protein n=1 Tax=Actinomadura alba TaxID=406431 RepID=A0ABR7LMX2_9ACTN|nr:trehalase family glycosidase [Actinomadura alba]MBC6465850.1 hypothetical protein [Actinomadura alba]
MSGENVSATPAPTGWNTWDVRTHTGMVHLPSGLRVRFGLLTPHGPAIDEFTWRDGLVRLGHHSVDGGYAEVTVEAGGILLHLVMAGGPGEVLNARAEASGTASSTASGTEASGTVVVAVDGWSSERPRPLDGIPGADEPTSRAGVRFGNLTWSVEASAAARHVTWADGLMLAFEAGTVDLRVAPDDVPGSVRDLDAVLAARRVDAERTRLRSAGRLGDAADALTRAVTWNTIYDPGLGRVLTPTSRDFVSAARRGFYGNWALHAWDTFFTGLAASVVDRDYARGIFRQILPYIDEAGMIPNRVSDDRGRTDDRSQPPVGALTVHRAYLAGGLSDATRDRALLTGGFPALLAWHDWWPRARRGPYGLLAWGSDPIEGDAGSATLDRAKRESGLDDSPMYDTATFDPAGHTMDLADVGLNALHIADAEALAAIADRLGEADTATRLRDEATEARGAAGKLLWDEERGGYRNLSADGRHDPHVSPTMLYPLLAGIPDATRAAAVAADLLRPEVLGGDRPLVSVARDDPAFAATYWRGRIWAPMAYLAVEGLRRYELTGLTRPVVDALLRLFLAEWQQHSHVRENYPAGGGEDLRDLRARSDGLMAWGGLLAYLAFTELADARPGGWRFAHPGEPAELRNLPLGDGRLDVCAADRLTVVLDGRVLLDATPGVTVSEYVRTPAQVTGLATGAGELLVAPPGDGEPVRLALDGRPRRFEIGPARDHRRKGTSA